MGTDFHHRPGSDPVALALHCLPEVVVSLIELRNAHLRVVVDADHGAEIVTLAGADDVNWLSQPAWRSPLPAGASESYGNQVLDWLSEYRGGWQELFPNAGAGCEVMGVPLPFHGEVSRARWQCEVLEESVHVRLTTAARLPLVLEREMRLDAERPVLYLRERVRSEALFPVPFIWGHHPAFGLPLAAPGAHIDLPASRVIVDSGLDGPAVDLLPGSEHTWPIAAGRHGEPIDLSIVPGAPVQRLCYIADLAEGWVALRNPQVRAGVALAWDLPVFPHLWFWQEVGGGTGFPWFGRGDIVALEPASQWPSHGLAAAEAAGQAHVLKPGETREAHLTCILFAAGSAPVVHAGLDGMVTTSS